MASPAAKGPVPRFYRALGVKPDATGKEIRKAYRALAVTRHPDKITTGQSTPEERESAQRDFVELAKAYEVLSDDVGRKRYDYWTSEHGSDAAYPEGSFDWSLIDQQLGLASMHHRDKSGATEAAGSRVWSMDEAERLFRETEILSKREHDDDDGDEDSNATVNMLAMLGLGVTTAASILIPLYISWNRTRAKHDEKARKKKPTTEQKAELAARRAAVSRREAEEQAQKRVSDEERKKSTKKKGEKEGGEGEVEDDSKRQKTWPRFDDTDPFLRRVQWIQRLTYQDLLQSLHHPHAAAQDATQASAAADVLTKFQSHVGEDAYEGVAYGLMSVVLEAHSTRARGVDVAALEELVGRWLDAESPVRVKLDDKWERVLKDSVAALVAMDEDDARADEEDDADADEERRQASESAVADALDKLSGAALDRLKQGGGKLKGIKEQWASFWSSEEGHRARETAVQLDDVLESEVATNAFAEHLEFEGGGGDLELYFELAAATEAEDAEQRKEAALGMLDRFFSEDAEGPLPSVAEELEGVAEDLRALVEDEEDDREEEEEGGEDEEEELVVPLLQDMLAHTRESLVESLASFTSHVYRPMGGGKAEKSKVYARLWKAAHAVVGSGSATQGGGSEQTKKAGGDVEKSVADVKSSGGGRVVKGEVEEEEEEEGLRGGKAKGGGGRGKGGKAGRKA